MIPRAGLGGVVVAVVVLLCTTLVRAQPVENRAMVPVVILPLDTDKSLALYGQPVANELGRALKAGDIDVVIVGPKVTIPYAGLVIDGTVKQGGADQPKAVVISLRIRNPADGKVLEQLSSTAPALANIDEAAADLAGRMLPLVRAQLEQLVAAPPPPTSTDEPEPSTVPVPMPPPPPPPLAIAISAVTGTPAVLRAALAPAVEPWARAARRDPHPVAPAALAADPAGVHVAFVVLDYDLAHEHGIALARARVRVTITGARVAKPFDRIIATDSIVGGRGEPAEQLAARTAAEVLAILRPHVRRAVGDWP